MLLDDKMSKYDAIYVIQDMHNSGNFYDKNTESFIEDIRRATRYTGAIERIYEVANRIAKETDKILTIVPVCFGT
jgi:hypothetical protein